MVARIASSPIAMAHRGFSGGTDHALENSLKAFEAAVDLGYLWVETDVHATSDGVLLAFHDVTLERVTDSTGAVTQLEWAQVSQARIGGVEPIACLEELLLRWPDLHVNIDIKSDSAIDPLVAVINRLDAASRVRVSSFSDRRRRAALKQLPDGVRTAPGQQLMALLWAVSHLPGGVARPLFRRLSRGIDALQIPESFGKLRVLHPALLQVAHDAGCEVHVWTVNEADEMNRLLDEGVDGLITDRADILKEVLIARGEWIDRSPSISNAD